MENLARSGSGNELMNNPLTDYEVGKTFCNGSLTPGPDGIASRLIDEADRELMHECLKILWNKAWSDGHFITDWKREDRVIIPKLGKEDYSECSAYRTISLTSCLGTLRDRSRRGQRRDPQYGAPICPPSAQVPRLGTLPRYRFRLFVRLREARNAKPEVVWSRDRHGNGSNR